MLIPTLKQYESCTIDQTEFVIIDDCSDDESVKMLKDYKKNSKLNIVFIECEKNGGAGAARNIGLLHAHGDYITFMDSDDSLKAAFFDDLKKIIKLNVDCVVFDATIVSESHEVIQNYSMFMKDFPAGPVYKKDAMVFVKGCTWGKIYRRSLIIDNNVVFLTQPRNEDMPFTKYALFLCKSVYYRKKAYYNYIQNSLSLMHNNKLLDPRNAQRAFLFLQDRIKAYDSEMEAIFLVEYLYSTVKTNLHTMNNAQIKQYINKSESMYPNCYSNKYMKYFPKKITIVLKLIKLRLIIPIRLIVNIYPKILKLVK